MREIKFRGKRIDDGEWITGYYIKTGKYFHGGETHCIAIEGHAYNYAGLNFVSVIPETVSQYTGFKDRNDKEIYEGDIIQIPDDYDIYGMDAGEIYEVIFSHGGFRMKAKYNKNSKGYYLDDNNSDEIIGNKFDNPELLEVQ